VPRTPRSQLPAADLADVPLDEAPTRRTRLRRGGPRTPLPLLPLIAALAGVGVAYVSQSAHSTQATYQATTLAQQNQQLRSQASQLGDELARLESAERIVSAAQQLGMRPAGHWSYVNAQLKPVVDLPAPLLATQARSADPLQQLVAAIGGAFGVHGTQGASP
jgi:cell division protein FtsL